MKGGFGSISDIHHTNEYKTFVFYHFLIPLVTRMGGSHAPGRGSIPRWGNLFDWIWDVGLGFVVVVT
jgi:hypothetical protein